ncbi:MAG: hypothetical protein AAGC67_01780 [Myxococcota bacterium]
MRIGASLLGLGILLAASATDARELEFYLENRIGGDSNVFRREQTSAPGRPSVKGGAVYEITPRVTLRDRGDALEYEFTYQPTYEQFFLLEGNNGVGDVSGLDHSAFGELSWRVSPSTFVAAEGAYFRQRRVREEITGVVASDRTLEANDSNFIERGRGSLDFQRSLNGRLSLTGGYGFDSLDPNEDEQSDTISHRGSLGLNYALDRHTRVGVTFNLRDRNTSVSIPATTPPPETLTFRSNTRTYDVSLSISRSISEHWDLSVAVGPSVLRTEDENSFTPGTTSNDDNSIFAQALSTYRFKNGELQCAYIRSESGGGGGAAASSIYDDVSCQAIWTPYREWTFRVEGGWNRRESVPSNFLSGLEVRTDRIWAAASATYRFSNRLSVIGNLRWADQAQDEFRFFFVNRTVLRDFILGRVAVRYTFEPYVF